MVISGGNLSLFGRTALAGVGHSRASQRTAAEPVTETEATKDPTSSAYKEVQNLKQRDLEVRQHEQAHIAAGGSHVQGGASFSYTRGPDGKQYATGGEVKIDDSAVSGDPAATIRKMQAIKSAALAPAQPSAQDRSVAAQAAQTESRARVELREQQSEAAEVEESDSEVQGEAPEPVESGAAETPRARNALNAYQGAAAAFSQANQPSLLLDLTA